jgi:nucleotide-binding universal stress UspA family protein
MGAWRSILAVLGEGARSASVLRMAASIATRMGAELEALQASKQPSVGAFLAPEGASVAQQWARERAQQRRVQMQAVVRQVESECGLPIPFGFVAGDPLDHTLGRACGADLVVVGQPDPDDEGALPAAFVERLLLGSGGPVLLVPGFGDWGAPNGEAVRSGGRVLVAWTPRRESLRAVRDALPLLRTCAAVELVRCARPGETDDDLLPLALAHLLRHEVPATARTLHTGASTAASRFALAGSPDLPVAEALLSHAADSGADLIIMGGYGHSRAWELVLGGVTRTLMRSMTVPVLFSH